MRSERTRWVDRMELAPKQLSTLIAIKILSIRNQDITGETVAKLLKTTRPRARGVMHLLEGKKLCRPAFKMMDGSNSWSFAITDLGNHVLKANIGD